MDEIQSGKELCDQFFEALINREDIDHKTIVLLKDLYLKDKLTAENILQELKALRLEQGDEPEN